MNERLQQFNNYIKVKKIAVIGLGVSNGPLIDYLLDLGADITIFDNRDISALDTEVLDKISKNNIQCSFGQGYLSKLVGFDVIFRSPTCRPDIPEIEAEVSNGAFLTSEIEMLLQLCPARTIGVTGSDGKTTTTTLIYEILKQSGRKCYLGGNIGIPLFTQIAEMNESDIVVLELSSFQLMNMEISPDIAVVTNISPNHLDIHKSYEEYIESKANIFRFQNKDSLLVVNYDNQMTREFGNSAAGKVVYFSRNEKLRDGVVLDDGIIKVCDANLRRHVISTKNMKLRGIHNAENACAAIAATTTLVDVSDQVEVLSNFAGVKHRLEYIRETNGVKWYNDAIGTSPSRSIACLESFDENMVLIAGGYDKNLDYNHIAKPIVEKVSKLILMGQTAEKIKIAVSQELEKQNKSIEIYHVDSLEEAVIRAGEVAVSGEVVVMSPASASFDMFRNFEEKGDKFKELVNKI